VRFSVQGRYDFTGEPVAVGRVERGTLRAGAELVALPGGGRVRVRRIVDFPPRELESLDEGRAGSVIVDRPERLRRGAVLAPREALPPAGTGVAGRTFCLGPAPIARGARYLFRCATQEVQVRVESVEDRLDSGSLAPLPPGDEAGPLELAVVRLRGDEPLVTEDPNESPALGRFVLEHRGAPVALGMVIGPAPPRGGARR
jgi:bifunctional enzyme CysN/CysC